MEAVKYTIKQLTRYQARIKRSLFIGTISPTKTVEEAEEFIARIKKEFSDATHNCFAYRINDDLYRYYDDGEPSGTAGLPILNMLKKYNLFQTTIVVTRYFGGIKLGTGGLMRAYSQCAEEAILSCQRIPLIDYITLKITYPYTLTNQIQKILHQFPVEVRRSEYQSDVEMILDVPREVEPSFAMILQQLGQKNVKIIKN